MAFFALISLCFYAPSAFAADIDTVELALIWTIPFIGLLLSIAFFPIIMPVLWHHHAGKIVLAWAAVLLIPYTVTFGLAPSWHMISHAFITEYFPFIILLFTLYTLSGGIFIAGRLQGTPLFNTGILALGTILASVMGTTGAAMLFIHPLIRANKNRQYRVHIVIFFIFLVGNIGGGLTPLGDPPLFIGFLKGVSFAWTLQHMLLPVLLASSCLLFIFYCLERYYYKKEMLAAPRARLFCRVKIFGKGNFVLLIGVVLTVLCSGVWQPNITISLFDLAIPLESVVRDMLLLFLSALSLLFTPKQIRAGNAFNWGPVNEVAKLFAGIFITIAPVIAILHAGKDGGLAPILHIVSTEQGEPIDARYFWITGLLSSLLDNAPTYLVFFNLANGDAMQMMGPLSSTLLAISMGAVFMGATTYIGNAPNFMVKAIAEQHRISMPGFFGYIRWSFCYLMPLFVLLTWLFF